LIVLQVVWLKTELCSALEARKAATCRAEELEVALMEMVKEDNRLLLSAQVEKLEAQIFTLKKALSDKEEQEQVMVQVLVRMEQEQRIADDARRFAELDAAAQRSIADEAKVVGFIDVLKFVMQIAASVVSLSDWLTANMALGIL
jgi:flagellum-specific peptidoglycan hydrolase FlgJ